MSHKPETLSHAIVRLERIRKQHDLALDMIDLLVDEDHEIGCAYENAPVRLAECPCLCYHTRRKQAAEAAAEIRTTIHHRNQNEST